MAVLGLEAYSVKVMDDSGVVEVFPAGSCVGGEYGFCF